MTGKQLTNSILQWAIQGKLVPQDPNDEPASVLLEKIRAEKARLIKEGKIKKDKKESIIYRGEDNSYYEKFADGKTVCIDDEIPFEVPSGWEWCRLGCLCSKFSTGPFGTMVHKSDYTDDGIPLVNPTNIKGQQIVAENICKVAQTKYDELRAYVLSKNDIVLARRGDLSKCAIVNEEQIGWLAGTGSFFLHILGLSLDFFIMLYTSPYTQDYLIGDSVGTTMNNLNQGLLSRMLIPIPPLFEQSRIIEYFRSIMPLIERYTVTSSERKALDDVLSLQIKKSVLQEAIQGRLVPQDPNDEPASILLQHVKDEKQRLVTEGKLKKKDVIDSTIFRGDDNKYFEKKGKDSICIDEEIPFDIPDTWSWTRLSNVAEIYTGNSISETEKKAKYTNVVGRYYIGTKDVGFDNKVSYNNGVAIPKKHEQDFRIAPKDSILMCIEGGSAGRKIAIINQDVCFGNKLCCFSPFVEIGRYIYYYLQSPSFIDMFNGNKTGIIGGVSIAKVKEILIPLPPQQELERIVAKIDEFVASIMSR